MPKIVRYAVNYLKCLASDDYSTLMDTKLRVDLERGDRTPLARSPRWRRACWRRYTGMSRQHAGCAGHGGIARHAHERLLVHLHACPGLGASEAGVRGVDTMWRRYKAAAEEAAWEH